MVVGLIRRMGSIVENDYIEQYKLLHKKQVYGVSSIRADMLEIVEKVIDKERPSSILDYGCGQSSLMDLLYQKEYVKNVYRYDPAVDAYSYLTVHNVDLVICIDVLEHIPRECLYSVVYEIHKLSNKVFFSIGLTEATMILPNGSNAHCTVMSKDWWLGYLEGAFGKVTVVGELRAKFQCVTW